DDVLEGCARVSWMGGRGDPDVLRELRRVLAGDRLLLEAECVVVGRLEDQWFLLRAVASAVEDGVGAVLMLSNISARKQLEGRVGTIAGADQRTGLPDERALVEVLSRQREAGLGAASVTVTAIALRGVDAVGRVLGAPATDQLVAQVIARVRRAVRQDDLICRGAPLELLVINPALDPEAADAVAERLRRACAEPYQIGAHQVVVPIAVGCYQSGSGASAEAVLDGARLRATPLPGVTEPAIVGPAGWARPGELTKELSETLSVEEVVRARTAVLDSVGEAVVALDTKGRVMHMNGAAEQVYGWSRDEAQGRHIAEVGPSSLTPDEVEGIMSRVLGGGSWVGDVTIAPPRRASFLAQATAAPLYVDGVVSAIVTSTVDVSGRARPVEPPEVRAAPVMVDPVTGLPPLSTFLASLEAQLAVVGGESGAGTVTVVLIELDDVARMRPPYGEAMAEHLLRSSASALRSLIHVGDVLTRSSAAGFAVSCPHLRGSVLAKRYADDLRAAMQGPVPFEGGEVVVRSAAGIALGGHPNPGAEELVRRAEAALVHARDERTASRVFDQEMDARHRRQVELDALVRARVAAGQIPLAYQAITRLDDGTVVGAEALLRLTDDRGQAVPPMEALAAADRCGLSAALGRLVLDAACQEAARWQRFLPERVLAIAVNVSAEQFRDRNTAHQVHEALKEASLAPSRLTLEVSESLLMEDTVWSARQLAVLKMQGVQLAADDYGTGNTSLLHLKRFPLDFIKADLSLVAGLPDSPEDSAIVAATIRVAEALDLHVIAEGVENERQRDELHRLGCEFGQGYLWSTAVSGDDFLKLVVESRRSPIARRREVARQGDPVAPGRRPASVSEVEELDAVLRSLAHEIRTPLTVAMGYASLLETGADSDQSILATSIRQATERIDHLLGNLEDVRLIDIGRLELDAQRLDLRDLVKATVDELQSVYRVPLDLRLAGTEPVEVDIDPLRIGQVLTNLVSNAAKFVQPGSKVAITVESNRDWAEVSVSDDGPGVAEADLGLIYRKYGRSDPAHAGSGLGLYLARGTARAHGGDILYRRGRPGSTFILTLPLPSNQLG
ncbi:MAG: hypothetical protein JWM47_1190, partial [Acidimicrobiales bacterium]|nr:hypothetical protein [Acidimicrobiales bacterium]